MFSCNLFLSLCFSSAFPPAEVMAQCSPKFSSVFFVSFLLTLFYSTLGFPLKTIIFSLFYIFTFTPWNTRKDQIKRKMTSETQFVAPYSSSVPAQSILTHCCPFDWQIRTTPLFSHAVWAQDVFIYKDLCIIDALLLRLGTALSEMATSKTLYAVCLWRENMIVWEREKVFRATP